MTPSKMSLTTVLVGTAACLVPAATVLASSDDNCLPRPTPDDRTAVLSGTTDDDADWVAGFGVDDRDIQLVCVKITFEGEDATTGVLGGPFNAAEHDDEVVVSVLTTGPRVGPRWHVVRGTVTDAADRVEVTIGDATEPVEADIADTGPEEGWRWYAIVVPADVPVIPHVEATAYDADGEVIAEGDSAF